jgi:hypothetical protein
MPAIFDRVLTENLVANTAIFYVAARLYLLPLVPRVRPQQILVPILLLHSMRHLGLMFLTRGATPTTAMTHIAIQEALDGKMVEWMEHVSDEQYQK